MILQYFKKKENEYKKIADKIYLFIIIKSKELINNNNFNEVSFDTLFELISILLVFNFKLLKGKSNSEYKLINDLLMQNFIDDLDNSFREMGIGDMSVGKYVKKYVKKFYYRIKLIDPILDELDERLLLEYLNSLKFIDKKYTKNIVEKLKQAFKQIENNSNIV